MSDQAAGLRRKQTGQEENATVARVKGTLRGIAVASGKGGVGKTNAVANIAYSLANMGKRALIFDADMGLGNVHILLGLAPRYNIQHVMDGERRMEEIIIKGPGGVDVLPAGSGHRSYSELNGEEMLALKTELEALEEHYDYILFDIGAGISANVMYFCSAAEEVVILTTTEPTAFADAYALMKVLVRDYNKTTFNLIVNQVKNARDAETVHYRLEQVADRFNLGCRLNLLGYIVADDVVPKAVRQQRLFAERFPNSRAAQCAKTIAATLVEASSPAGIGWEKVFNIS